MTFPVVHTWTVNEKFTSSQANSITANLANALDKTGDTISSGSITLSGSGAIFATVAGSIQASVAGALTASAAGAITSATTGGIKPGVTGGITSDAAGGITSSVSSGIRPGVAGGITSNVTSGISSAVTKGIDINASGGLYTTAAGGIQLGNGPTDLALPGGLTVRRFFIPAPMLLPTNWAVGNNNGPALTVPSTNSTQKVFMPISYLHDGAVLSRISVVFAVNSPHAGVPANLPAVEIRRTQFATSGTTGLFTVPVDQSLVLAGAVSPATPGSGAAWYNSANLQVWDVFPDQHNTIDRANFTYYMTLTDENGANSQPLNYYYGFFATYTSIADMRFT